LLLRRIDGDTSRDVRSIVEPELIVRQSTDRAAGQVVGDPRVTELGSTRPRDGENR
jgi:hypothetical protein